MPFVILAPHGVWHSISVQLGRPLQIESLGAATLVGLHHLFGIGREHCHRLGLAKPGREPAPA